MAVFIQFINVLVPVSVLNEKYPDGLDGYIRDHGRGTFCCDGRLTRVGFMSPVDAEQFLIGLENQGLTLMEGDAWKDIAIVAQPSPRATAGCSWIAVGRMLEGPDFACLRDDVGDPGEIHVTESGTVRWILRNNYYFTPFEHAEDEVRILSTEDLIDTCFDTRTGATVKIRGLSRFLEFLEYKRSRREARALES